jgi:cell pole-organizing protein PopZ
MLMSEFKSAPEPSMDEILASIRRILAEDGDSVARGAAPVLVAADVLDLTEALNEDGTVRHIAPTKLVPPQPAPRLSGGRIEPAAPRPAGPAATPRLVSDTAADAVAASFARLSAAPRQEGSEPPLDDLVRETLRPLLQAWLDEHLPELVERLVRSEIERVIRNGRPLAP